MPRRWLARAYYRSRATTGIFYLLERVVFTTSWWEIIPDVMLLLLRISWFFSFRICIDDLICFWFYSTADKLEKCLEDKLCRIELCYLFSGTEDIYILDHRVEFSSDESRYDEGKECGRIKSCTTNGHSYWQDSDKRIYFFDQSEPPSMRSNELCIDAILFRYSRNHIYEHQDSKNSKCLAIYSSISKYGYHSGKKSCLSD